MPKKDMIRFRYELDNKFKINIKTVTDIRIIIIFVKINNNDFM